jgi:hypothetical protein
MAWIAFTLMLGGSRLSSELSVTFESELLIKSWNLAFKAVWSVEVNKWCVSSSEVVPMNNAYTPQLRKADFSN